MRIVTHYKKIAQKCIFIKYFIVTDLVMETQCPIVRKTEAPVPITRFIANPISATSRPKTP